MRRALFLGIAWLLCVNSYAFEVSGNFWEAKQATYHVGMSGTSPSGTSWNTSFKRAMSSWTAATNFEFLVVDSFRDPCSGRANNGFGDNISAVDFTADVCGNAFGSSTLAVTLTAGTCLNQECTGGIKIKDADIVFKNSEKWDVYTGPRRSGVLDFERVALHELGHALGLRHENSNPAIMQPLVTDTHTLQADDINGANVIYPGSANIPLGVTIGSIYGVNIVVPAASKISGPSNTVNQSGALISGDTSLEGKFLDMYQFTFANDSIVDLRLNSTAFDPFLYLVRISSTQDLIPAHTFTDDNSGTGSNALISKSVQAGTYWVGASPAAGNQQGSYDLTLISANNNPTSSFQSFQSIYGANVQINPNPSIAGALSSSDFVFNGKRLDLFQFTVLKQTKLRVDLSATLFDPVLIIARLLPGASATMQEVDQKLLLQNDNFGSGLNSRIEQSLSPGNYWTGVTSANVGQTGDYQIETTVVLP